MAKKKENNDLVPAWTFADNGKYSDDITLGLNGSFSKIQRGETVMLSRDQREVLEHSRYQDESTNRMINSMQREYLQKNI